MDSPRGRIYLMKSLAEGRMGLDDDAVRHFDLCPGCRGCETACPSGVHYGRLIEGARLLVEQNHRRSFVDRFKRRAIGAIFPYPHRLRMLLAPLKLVDRFGLRPVLGAVLPRIFFRRLNPTCARSPRKQPSRRARTHRQSSCIADASRKYLRIRKT